MLTSYSLPLCLSIFLVPFLNVLHPHFDQIDQEREGEQIDRALLKNVLDIFVEIGMGQMDHYEADFEESMLKDTAAYYSIKASNWIVDDSCPDYMLKVIFFYPDNPSPAEFRLKNTHPS